MVIIRALCIPDLCRMERASRKFRAVASDAAYQNALSSMFVPTVESLRVNANWKKRSAAAGKEEYEQVFGPSTETGPVICGTVFDAARRDLLMNGDSAAACYLDPDNSVSTLAKHVAELQPNGWLGRGARLKDAVLLVYGSSITDGSAILESARRHEAWNLITPQITEADAATPAPKKRYLKHARDEMALKYERAMKSAEAAMSNIRSLFQVKLTALKERDSSQTQRAVRESEQLRRMIITTLCPDCPDVLVDGDEEEDAEPSMMRNETANEDDGGPSGKRRDTSRKWLRDIAKAWVNDGMCDGSFSARLFRMTVSPTDAAEFARSSYATDLRLQLRGHLDLPKRRQVDAGLLMRKHSHILLFAAELADERRCVARAVGAEQRGWSHALTRPRSARDAPASFRAVAERVRDLLLFRQRQRAQTGEEQRDRVARVPLAVAVEAHAVRARTMQLFGATRESLDERRTPLLFGSPCEQEDATQTDLACMTEQLVARVELFLHFYRASSPGKRLGDEICQAEVAMTNLLGTRNLPAPHGNPYYDREGDDAGDVDDDAPSFPSTRLLERLRSDEGFCPPDEYHRSPRGLAYARIEAPFVWRHDALVHVLQQFPALVTVGHHGGDEDEDEDEEREFWVEPVVSPSPSQERKQAARARELRRRIALRYVEESAKEFNEAQARLDEDTAALEELSEPCRGR